MAMINLCRSRVASSLNSRLVFPALGGSAACSLQLQPRRFSSGRSKADVELLAEWGARAKVRETCVSGEVGSGLVSIDHNPETGVAVVTLNRSSKFNSLSMNLFADVETAFARLAQESESVRCVVLNGAGDHFCAGIDVRVLMALKEVCAADACPSRSRENMGNVIQRFQEIMSLPEECHAPVIAAIHGVCIGAGVDFATACDLRVCSADAVFNVKEADLAIVADLGTLQRLPRCVGEQRARELALTARDVSGPEAKELGLVLDCYDTPEAALASAIKLAETIASKSPVTVRGVKKTLNYGADRTVEEGLEYVLRWNEAHLLSSDLDNIVQAMMTRAKPKK